LSVEVGGFTRFGAVSNRGFLKIILQILPDHSHGASGFSTIPEELQAECHPIGMPSALVSNIPGGFESNPIENTGNRSR
jgi:hypothetical protein